VAGSGYVLSGRRSRACARSLCSEAALPDERDQALVVLGIRTIPVSEFVVFGGLSIGMREWFARRRRRRGYPPDPVAGHVHDPET